MCQIILIEVERLLCVLYFDSRGDRFMVLYTRSQDIAQSLVRKDLLHYAQNGC